MSAPGVGTWEPAWERTVPEQDALMNALNEWLDNDVPETRADLEEATRAYVDSWRMVSKLYEKQGG